MWTLNLLIFLPPLFFSSLNFWIYRRGLRISLSYMLILMMFLYSLLYLDEYMKFNHLRFPPLHLNWKGILGSLWSYTILLIFSCRLLRQSVSYVTPLVRWYPHSTMFCSHLSWRKSLDAYGRYELVVFLLRNWNCFLLFSPSKAMCIDYISTLQMKKFIRILHVTVYYWGR